MTTASARTVRLGGRDYPLQLPSVRDPRLHVAAVIVSIHVLGQVALGFRVSVPQILVAIVTCAVIEVAWTFRQDRRIVWPASAMLTGSGVALILRLVGMPRGDTWSWEGWYIFAAVAGFSLVSKYVIRWRGTHLFNPSNFGLVVAFLLLGSDIIEPLDFWWGPLDAWLVLAYAVIVVGGLAITARLGLVAIAAASWLAFAAFLGVLTVSGHCMTTAWALQPVCGTEFWRVVTFSPELLIFLFFMMTDPRTVPEGRQARVVFAVAVAALSTLLIAPQSQEFGAKVGLLAGLVLLTPVRGLFDRMLHEGRRPEAKTTPPSSRYLFGVGAVLGSLVAVSAAGITVAGGPARGETSIQPAGAVAAVDVEIDPSTLPQVVVSSEAAALNSDIASQPALLADALAEDLAIEGEAMLRQDTSLLRSADTAQRLLEMERAIEAAATAGRLVIDERHFDDLRLDVVYANGPQGGAGLALTGSGTVEEVTYDPTGSELSRTPATAFASSFEMAQSATGRWLLSRVTDLSADGS